MTTIALGTTDRVTCWCNFKRREDGAISFSVINGGWSGVFFPDRNVLVADGEEVPAQLLWEGEVPREFARHYNDAIPWISEQLATG